MTSRPLLLMIHGVNSTLEWSKTVLKVLEPHFRCQLVRYRYFHSPWGAIKVYIWPAALLLGIAYLLAAWPYSWTGTQRASSFDWTGNLATARSWNWVALALLCVLLVVETWIVVGAERSWAGAVDKIEALWAHPVVFCLAGLTGALIFDHPYQWAAPAGALVGIAIFLDLREYPARSLSVLTLLLLPAGAMILAGWLIYDVGQRAALTPSIWFLLGVLILGVVEPFWRGSLAFERVRETLDDAAGTYPQPFVVAHSLGTYLTGHVLHEVPQLHLGRVVFTGCVLDRLYPWQRLVPPRRIGVVTVANYCGGMDWVPLLTGSLRFLWRFVTLAWLRRPLDQAAEFLARQLHWRPLGFAGILGFTHRPEVVHTQPLGGACADCVPPALRAPVHNLPHGWADHSRLNNEKSFQEWSWLPSLWGMSPFEYDEWVRLCRYGHDAAVPLTDAQGEPVHPYQPADPDGLQHWEEKLLTTTWCWPTTPVAPTPAAGRLIDGYMAEILVTMGATVTAAQLRKRLPKLLFDAVHEAWTESEKGKDEAQDAAKLERLHPQRALRHAVAQALAIQ